MNWNLLFDCISAFGALATVGSLAWAVHIFRVAHEREEIIGVRNAILTYPVYCKKIERLLSEPVFSAIGNGIAEELEKYMPEGQSLETYTNDFMLNSSGDNYKALAIYMGMKKCDEINEIDEVITNIEECHRNMVSKFPVMGKSFSMLSYYVTLPAEKAITAKILNNNLKFEVDGKENEGLKRMLEEALEAGSKELYFKRIALHLEGAVSANLTKSAIGQDSISLSRKMIEIISKKFEIINDRKLESLSALDRKNINLAESLEALDNKNRVEKAMELLKIHKNIFEEEEWERLIEYKGRIVQLLEDK